MTGIRNKTRYRIGTHPEAALVRQLASQHIALGCSRCKTLLDALGHIALLRNPPIQVFRQGRIQVLSAYDGYICGDKIRRGY